MKKSLYVKLAIFFLIITTISGGVYHFVTTSLTNSKNISYIINEVGRERMLSEKISKKAIQLVLLNNSNTKNDLISAENEFEDNLNRIKREIKNERFKTIKEELNSNIETIEQQWSLVKTDIDQLLSDREKHVLTIGQMDVNSDKLLLSLDKIVRLLEKEDSKSLQGLTTDNILLLSFNLIFIIILFVIWRLLVSLSNSEKKYRILIENSPLGIMMFKDSKVKFINKFALQSLGFSSEMKIIGKPIYTFIHPKYHELVTARLNCVQEKNQVADLIEEEWVKANGEVIIVEVMSIPFYIMGNNINLTIFRDITEQRRSSNYFKELINIKEALEKSSIVEITDNEGVIQYVNDKFCDISKFKASEVVGKTYRMLKSSYHTQEFYKVLWETISQGKVWEGQVKNRAKDGTFYWTQTIIIPFINNNGEPYQYLTIRNDITDKKEAEEEIHLLATKDHLTQLLNRRAFEQKLQEQINRQESVAVFFLDLDRFKYINDSLGHSIGDILLKLVADRLRKIAEDASTESAISRLGGDEFTILFKYTDKRCISKFAKQIINEIKRPFLLGEKELLITCSIGVSIYPDHGKDFETLMKNADVAMYWSKQNGKNDYSIYQNHMIEKSAEIMELELELRKAVDNKEFVLYYQPKVDLFTGEIVGCEALIRWNHPSKGLISPTIFIPLAEETGLINAIGDWALKEACRECKKLHEEGFSELQMAVNISVYQLKQENFVSTIESVLQETQLNSRFLELEITESISMLSRSNKINKLYELKEIGVSLAIDDFGTGYSSLKYLTKMPVDTLKIDKSFIDEIGRSNHLSALMINAIISLAKSLNLEVVAEGIETEEQMNYLTRHYCDVGQGYLISKPLKADELEEFLSSFYYSQHNTLKPIAEL
ncbi:EAL domain-containing protein [Schinkia sp. CFF1]